MALAGGGGHALVVADAILQAGGDIAGVYDDASVPHACAALGLAHLGTIADMTNAGISVHLAVGDLAARARILESLARTGVEWVSVISPWALVARGTQIAKGVFVAHRAVVNPLARVGAHAIINTGAIVEHECEIGENAHVAPGAVLGGNVRIGSGTLIGLGARVLPGIKVGSSCTVGAGAVVTRDVADNTVVAGVPARRLSTRC